MIPILKHTSKDGYFPFIMSFFYSFIFTSLTVWLVKQKNISMHFMRKSANTPLL